MTPYLIQSHKKNLILHSKLWLCIWYRVILLRNLHIVQWMPGGHRDSHKSPQRLSSSNPMDTTPISSLEILLSLLLSSEQRQQCCPHPPIPQCCQGTQAWSERTDTCWGSRSRSRRCHNQSHRIQESGNFLLAPKTWKLSVSVVNVRQRRVSIHDASYVFRT